MNLLQTIEQNEIARASALGASAKDGGAAGADGKAAGAKIPPFAAGDQVAVRSYVVDGTTKRVQSFEGMVIARRRNNSINASFTVRRTSFGESMERTYQLHSPLIESVKVLRHGKVRQAKLYYLRERSGKSARIPEKLGAKKNIKPR